MQYLPHGWTVKSLQFLCYKKKYVFDSFVCTSMYFFYFYEIDFWKCICTFYIIKNCQITFQKFVLICTFFKTALSVQSPHILCQYWIISVL